MNLGLTYAFTPYASEHVFKISGDISAITTIRRIVAFSVYYYLKPVRDTVLYDLNISPASFPQNYKTLLGTNRYQPALNVNKTQLLVC